MHTSDERSCMRDLNFSVASAAATVGYKPFQSGRVCVCVYVGGRGGGMGIKHQCT